MGDVAKERALNFLSAEENTEEAAIFNLLVKKAKLSFLRRKCGDLKASSQVALKKDRKSLKRKRSVESVQTDEALADLSDTAHNFESSLEGGSPSDEEDCLAESRRKSRKASRQIYQRIRSLRTKTREIEADMTKSAVTSASEELDSVHAAIPDRTPISAWHKNKTIKDMILSSDDEDDDLYHSTPVRFRLIHDEVDEDNRES